MTLNRLVSSETDAHQETRMHSHKDYCLIGKLLWIANDLYWSNPDRLIRYRIITLKVSILS